MLRFLIVGCLFITSVLHGQDKVVLLNGDTLDVKIPGHPRKETKLHKRVLGHINDYGFARVVVIFPPDSLRIVLPNQIKGYFRKEIGAYLGSGYFESRNVHMSYIGYRKLNKERPVFLQRVFTHNDFTFWYYREHMGEIHPETWYLIEQKGHKGYQSFYTYRDWMNWAKNNQPFDELSIALPKPKLNNSALFNYFLEIGKLYKQKDD